MMTVTDLPSGQRLVWPLQTFTRSGSVIAETALALLETSARSRAAASETLTAKNRQKLRVRRKNTRFLRHAKWARGRFSSKMGGGSTVTKVMYLWSYWRMGA